MNKNWSGIIGLCIFAFVIFMDFTIVGNAIPSIQMYFHCSTNAIQWLLLSLCLVYSSLMLIFCKAAEYVGLKKMVYGGFFLFGLSSLGAGLSTSIEMLIFFRFLQGIFSSNLCIIPALIAQNVPPEKQAQAISMFSTCGGIGVGIGPVVGGFLVQYASWRWVFLINIIIVLVGFIVCLPNVNEVKQEKPQTPFDLLGSILLTTFLTTLLLVASEGHQWGWDSFALKSLYLICAASLFLFIFVETKAKDPIIHINYFLDNVFISAILIGMMTGILLGVCLFYDPIYNQFIRQYNPVTSGILLAIVSIMMLITSPITAKITNKYGTKIACVLVLVYCLLSFLLHTQYDLNSSVIFSILAMIFLGMAWSSGNVSPMVALVQTVPTRNQASAIGVYGTSWNLGSSVGLGISSVLFYLLEKNFFIKHLSPQAITALHSQPDLMEKLLDNPEYIKQILHQFPNNIANSILDVYKISYVHALGWLMSMLFALVFLSIVFVIIVMKKK